MLLQNKSSANKLICYVASHKKLSSFYKFKKHLQKQKFLKCKNMKIYDLAIRYVQKIYRYRILNLLEAC